MTLVLASDKKGMLREKAGIRKRLKVGKSRSLLKIKLTGSLTSEASLSGTDSSGRPWKIEFHAEQLWIGYEIYSADFDNNGVRDLLFIDHNSANGFLPNVILQFVMFDKNGMPFPFVVPASDAGPERILDLNKNGRAEFVFSYYNYGADGDKWHGYYVTDAYEAENGRWERLKKIRGRMLPIFTGFENREKDNRILPVSQEVSPDQDTFIPKFSTDVPLRTQTRIRLLERTDDDRCNLSEQVLVADSKAGRDIRFIDLTNLKNVSKFDRMGNIQFFGQCEPTIFSPLVVWVRK